MRVLLVNTNRNTYLAPAPIGPMLIADHLRRAGHDARFVDLMHEKRPESALQKAVDEHRPELIGLSIRNRDNQSMEKLADPLGEIQQIATLARRLTEAPILIGGSAVTTYPRQFRAALGANYAFAGNDPDLVARLVKSLEAGRPDTSVPGLVYEQDGQVCSNPPVLRGYDSIRFSGYEQIDLKKYRAKGYYDCGVVTRTGCPTGCVFCDVHVTFGRNYVLRDRRLVADEMKELKQRHGARSLWMVDAGFNRPLGYAKELAAHIAEERVGVGFSCILEPGEIDAELARLLRKAGCQLAMLFGTTLSDPVLERNGLSYRSADLAAAARLLDREGISYMVGLLFGLPGETLKSVEESLGKSLELKPVMTQYGVGLRIQSDTPLRRTAIEEGVIPEDHDCFNEAFYCSRDAPAAEVRRRIKAFERSHPWRKLGMAKMLARMARDSIFGV